MSREIVKTSIFKTLFPRAVSKEEAEEKIKDDLRRKIGLGTRRGITEEQIKTRRERVSSFLNRF